MLQQKQEQLLHQQQSGFHKALEYLYSYSVYGRGGIAGPLGAAK